MESAGHGRLTRTTMFVAVFAVAMMLGPGLMLGNQNLSPADNASAVTTDRVLRLGWPGFYGSVRTLNPHTMTMGQEYMLILPCYSFLLTYDENAQAIGDLATKWTTSADGKTWHFWIVHTASFFDKNSPTQVPLTVDDVIFSFGLAQNNTASIYNYYLPKDPVTKAPMIVSMDKMNNYEMVFHLRMSFAPFMSALVGVPIVPQYIWQGKNIGWANFAHNVAPCIGSGPYYYAYDDIATIGSVGQSSSIMNPTWFGTIEYGWQPHVYQFIVKTETESSGIGNFNAGNLDVLISPTAAQFRDSDALYKFSSSQGFTMNMCINQLSLANRQLYGIGGPGAYNSQLLLDPTVKWALKMVVNKTNIVAQALLGGGSPSDSLMPSTSAWYYHYGSNTTRDTMLIPDSGNIPGARALLLANGWHYRTDGTDLLGAPDQNTYHPLCKVGGTQVLSFRYAYCDWYDFIITEGVKIKAWAQEAGIDLVGGQATSSQMNSYWSTANYDVYLWDWWNNPNSEPSLDIMGTYITDAIISRGTDVNDANATFDAMYYESLSAPTFESRKAILDEMQRWCYENSGYWMTAYRDNLYLAQTVAPNYWTGFGDWTTHYTYCPDSTYPWLFCRLSSATPGGNPAPSITSFVDYYPTDTGTNESFSAFVTDLNNLQYRWNWGDGTSTIWFNPVDYPTGYRHQYAADGYYTAHFMVKETTGLDGFISFATAKVKVIDTSNLLPEITNATFSPGDADSGTLVYFFGNATDSPLDTLSYTWDFGDGMIAEGQIVTHRFTSGAGIYSWTLMVNDGHLGSDPRPATYRDDIGVTLNSPPLISVPDEPSIPVGAPYLFHATASDLDARDHLKLTWDWGDGSLSVTTTTTCNHTYKFKRDFTLTVWADDGTFITSPPHNVSDTGLVHVWATNNSAPYVNFFWGSGVWTGGGYKVLKGATVTFYANVSDPDGDLADIYFGFGDGSPAYKVTQTTPNSTVSVLHQYPTTFGGGVYFPSVTYTDTIAASATRASTDFGWYMTVWETFSIHLVTGWNFVSLPLVGYGYKAGTLGLNNGDSVAQYNTATKTYTTHIVGVAVNNFSIAPSTGYWINVPSGTRDLTLYGYLPTTTQSRTITIPAGNNWAIIGFESFNMTRHARDVAAMWSVPGGITTVSAYNATSRTYTSWLKGIPTVNNFLIVPGQAYWILITTSGTLTYAP